nr:alpha-L-rhamnosidase C-terminal domain-containing protein [uncultured Clostridium sp.]
MIEYANWIWTGEWGPECDRVPTAVLFRKRIHLDMNAESAVIRISADSRYKLYINGRFVEAGPSKGDSQIWFYDEISIGQYLKKGQNVLAVIVLRFPIKPSEGNQSIMCTNIPGLFLQGSIRDSRGKEYDISADGDWKCRIDKRTRFIPEADGFAPLHFYEQVNETEEMWKWKEIQYDESSWEPAWPYPKSQIRDAVSPGNLNPRTIPFMRRKKGRFQSLIALRQSQSSENVWNRMLSGMGEVYIPPHSEDVVEIDAGEEMTGYLHLILEQGKGAFIRLLQAESYIQPDAPRQRNIPLKTDRSDADRGVLEGNVDDYYPVGSGDKENPEEYEPFWFRTFRFIRLCITTGDEPLIIRDFYFEEIGYPLDINSWVQTSDSTLTDIWDISARTLKRCMHETYMDCPFYEQLQYAMDSRSQILFTYAVSMDDKLARKCMDDFKRSQRYDGLIYSAYPNTRPNVIPGFSIFYICMLSDHMMYFGDKELIRYHMPSVEQVLNFYEKNRAINGCVGKIGGIYHQEKFWSFIDWAPQWKAGVPNATESGALTMESLLYLMGLMKAAELAEYIGRAELRDQYKQIAESVRQGIRDFCMSPEGWIQDGPGYPEFSQHCQVFGILTGVLDVETGRSNILETLKNRQLYAQCTVSMAFYLFRALEMVGLYEETEKCWDIWRHMIASHMTTVAESDEYPRSECHAWGALALYELPAIVLGVRPAAAGFEKILIRPVPGNLIWARGEVVTPKGTIYVEWEREKTKKMQITVTAEEAVMPFIVKDSGIKYISGNGACRYGDIDVTQR